MPNLPGFASNKHKPQALKQSFKSVNGVLLETTTIPQTHLRAMGAAMLSTQNSFPRLNTPPKEDRLINKTPAPLANAKWEAYARVVLEFNGFFKEAVAESANETYRVRQITLHYYMEDDTMQIVEHKQSNSGMPQGVFVRRQRAPRPDGGCYGVEDLNIGSEISMYGRTYVLCNCNGSTQYFIEEVTQAPCPDAIPIPLDQYNTQRTEFEKLNSGADQTLYRGSQKNPMKKFMEASLGNTVNNRGLAGFLGNDKNVLRFYTAWDNRGSMFGDLMLFLVHYFPADDTMEVMEQHTANSGRDPFPCLLKRGKLTRGGQTVDDPNGRADENDDAPPYHWSDFSIGSTIMCFGRELTILDVDGNTRRFYEQQGAPLGAGIEIDSPAPDSFSAAPPDHVKGFGTEEDSLQSCLSLVPKPSKTPFDIKGCQLPQDVLRFEARLDTDRYDDAMRRFVVSFFVSDGTLSVREPPVRNSGIVGGNFLLRQRVHNEDTGTWFAPYDLSEGARVTMCKRCLVITAVDGYTQAVMESDPDPRAASFK
jgi:hypothetical protein